MATESLFFGRETLRRGPIGGRHSRNAERSLFTGRHESILGQVDIACFSHSSNGGERPTSRRGDRGCQRSVVKEKARRKRSPAHRGKEPAPEIPKKNFHPPARPAKAIESAVKRLSVSGTRHTLPKVRVAVQKRVTSFRRRKSTRV